MRSFLAAVQLLTVVPVRGRFTAVERARSLAFFPLVGGLLGLSLAGAGWALDRGLPDSAVSALVVALMLLLTGGLHVDGLADTCDGLGARGSVEERWRVMSDSRVGGYAVMGALSVLLLKYAALSASPDDARAVALVVGPVAGRWAMTFAATVYPYAKPSGLGHSFAAGARKGALAAATVLALGACLLAAPVEGAAAAGCALVMALGLGCLLSRRFGGLTGDNYGAVNEAVEVAVFVVMLAFAENGWSPLEIPWWTT